MTAPRDSNEGATIREVYNLVKETRDEVLGAVDRLAGKQTEVVAQVVRLEARFEDHEDLEGHPKGQAELDTLKADVGRLTAAMKIISGAVVILAGALVQRLVEHGL